MTSGKFDFALGIGGAAGQGIATPGDTLARLFVRRGLYLNTYNAYQSIIRGGHIFLTVRVGDREVFSHGDKLDLLLCLNQDTMNRHLKLMGPGTRVIFNSDTIKPGQAAQGVQLCPMPVAELTQNNRKSLVQNTVALGVIMYTSEASRMSSPFRTMVSSSMPPWTGPVPFGVSTQRPEQRLFNSLLAMSSLTDHILSRTFSPCSSSARVRLWSMRTSASPEQVSTSPRQISSLSQCQSPPSPNRWLFGAAMKPWLWVAPPQGLSFIVLTR